ncbi:hypothetical protein [Clostridium oryzae]|uniref:Uncharacterized protein n=1 Tax=Clostridium oryzae TaxID=1450648 RepID=A0A1V4IH57_9CLOT|nr:hypothetical protein [Clostridium oryzae]OPJ59328.1 hypothetical protein CLORY_33370 [Clostridium oryzae]
MSCCHRRCCCTRVTRKKVRYRRPQVDRTLLAGIFLLLLTRLLNNAGVAGNNRNTNVINLNSNNDDNPYDLECECGCKKCSC